MRKIAQLTAAAFLAASALVCTASLASADATPTAEIQTDVGWGVAPASSPVPTASATASDVGWG